MDIKISKVEIDIRMSNLINESNSMTKQMLKLIYNFQHHAGKERNTNNYKKRNTVISLYHQLT